MMSTCTAALRQLTCAGLGWAANLTNNASGLQHRPYLVAWRDAALLQVRSGWRKVWLQNQRGGCWRVQRFSGRTGVVPKDGEMGADARGTPPSSQRLRALGG